MGICGFQLVRSICFNPEVRYIYLSLSTCHTLTHTHIYVCVGSGSSYEVIEDSDPIVYVLIDITVYMFMESVQPHDLGLRLCSTNTLLESPNYPNLHVRVSSVSCWCNIGLVVGIDSKILKTKIKQHWTPIWTCTYVLTRIWTC